MLSSRLLWSLLVILSACTHVDAAERPFKRDPPLSRKTKSKTASMPEEDPFKLKSNSPPKPEEDPFALKSKYPLKSEEDPFKLKSKSSRKDPETDDLEDSESIPENPLKRKKASPESDPETVSSSFGKISLGLPSGITSTSESIITGPIPVDRTFSGDQLINNDPEFPLFKSRGYEYSTTPPVTHPLPPPNVLMSQDQIVREHRLPAFAVGGAKMQVIVYPFSDTDIPVRAIRTTLEVLEFPENTPSICIAFTATLSLSPLSGTEMMGTESVYREHVFTREEPRARSIKLLNHDTIGNAIARKSVSGMKPLELSCQVALVDCGSDAFGWTRNPATLLKTTDYDEDRREDAFWDLTETFDHTSIKLHDDAVLQATRLMGQRSPYLQVIRKHDSISVAMPLRRPRQAINRVGSVNDGVLCYKNVIFQALYATLTFAKRLMAIEDRDNRLAHIKGIFWKLANPDNDLPVDVGGFLGEFTSTGLERQGDPGEFYTNLLRYIEDASRPRVNPQTTTTTTTTTSSVPSINTNSQQMTVLGDPSEEYQTLAGLLTLKYRAIHSFPQAIERAHELGREDVSSALGLEVGGEITSLEDAIWNHIGAQVANDYIVNTFTGERGNVQRIIKYTALPDMLMINLGRFRTEQRELGKIVTVKVHDRFEYPNEYDFSPLMMTPGDVERVANREQFTDLPVAAPEDGSNMYTLKAVICHKGASASSGHYYAYIRIRNCWFKFDDELITLVDRSEVFDRHYGGFETPEEEEDESSSTSSSEKPKEGDSEEAPKKNQGKPLPYSAYMLLYARNGVDPEILAREDVPETIAAVNRATPMEVKLLRDGHEAITLKAFSNQTVSKLIRDAELSLHSLTPHEFLIVTDGERHPSRVITRDSNIGGMRLSRLFQRSKNPPTIFAFPATLTPIQRLDNSLVSFTHASTPGATERLMLPRNGRLLDHLPAMRRAFTIPDVPETCIKFGRPGAVYTSNDFGLQMTANRLALTDCTDSRLFSPQLCDGTLLIMMPAGPKPPKPADKSRRLGKSHEGPSLRSSEYSSGYNDPMDVYDSDVEEEENDVPFVEVPPKKTNPSRRGPTVQLEEFMELTVQHTDFEPTIADSSVIFLPPTDTHKDFFGRFVESLKLPKTSFEVSLEFNDAFGDVNVYPESTQRLSMSIVTEHSMKDLKGVKVKFLEPKGKTPSLPNSSSSSSSSSKPPSSSSNMSSTSSNSSFSSSHKPSSRGYPSPYSGYSSTSGYASNFSTYTTSGNYMPQSLGVDKDGFPIYDPSAFDHKEER